MAYTSLIIPPFLQQSNIHPIGLSQLGYSLFLQQSSHGPILAWLFLFLYQASIHPIGPSQLGQSLYLWQSNIHPIGLSLLGYSPFCSNQTFTQQAYPSLVIPLFVAIKHPFHRPILTWLFPLFAAIKHSPHRPILAWLFPFLQPSNIHPIGLSQLD